MEKLNFEKAYKIFRECKAISDTECKDCPLHNIYDENDEDLCYSFCRIDNSIINYNRKISMEE